MLRKKKERKREGENGGEGEGEGGGGRREAGGKEQHCSGRYTEERVEIDQSAKTESK